MLTFGHSDTPDDLDASAPAAEHIKAARAQIRTGQYKKAYAIMLQAAETYPKNPVILSFCGWLQAKVDKKFQTGVASCRKAIANFKTDDQEIANAVYPLLYLNLGRALCLAGKKKEGIESLQKGLRYDKSHHELKKELKSLGIRKAPVISFLSRSNPLNKVLGKMLHKNTTK